jgi:hypothetical protein
MAVTKTINIKVKTGDAKASVDKFNQSLENTDDKIEKIDDSTSGLTNTLDTMTGGAITKFKGFTKGLKGISLGFKSIGTAIAASGIGLLIIVIAGITAAFKGSEEGQNRFAKLMGVIGAVVGNVVDVLADLGDFIIDLFSGDGKAMKQLKAFGASIYNVIGLPIKNAIDIVKALGKAIAKLASGDIKGSMAAIAKGADDVKGNFNEAKDAIDGATDALKDFVKQNIDEGKAAAKVADQRAKADKIERDLIVDRAKAERKIADLRLKARDLNNVTAKEREAALKEVLRINDGLIERETEVLKLRRDAQIAENTFARSNKENLTAEQEGIAAVIQAETRRVDQQRQIQRELTQAENQQESERKARAAAVLAARKEEIGKELELKKLRGGVSLTGDNVVDPEIELALINKDALAEIENDKTLIAKDYARARENIAKEEAAAKAEALDFYANALSSVSNLVGKETAAGKAFAVASTLMSTYLSAQKAYESQFAPLALVDSPIRGAIAAGVAVANGLANVKAILSVKTPAGGGGSGGVGSVSAPKAPSFNVVGNSGVSQIGQTLNQEQEPIQAYVTSGNVTSAQELDRNIVETASIG